jgi:hypothetical protein
LLSRNVARGCRQIPASISLLQRRPSLVK